MDDLRFKMMTLLTLLMLGFFNIIHATPRTLLSQNPVFEFTATAKDYQTVVLKWRIAPGNYLYRDRFVIRAVKPQTMHLAPPILPPNFIEKEFPPLGRFAVYEKNLYIIQPILNSNRQHITLQVQYQGCSNEGTCYPPITTMVSIDLSGDYMRPVTGIEMDAPPPITPPAKSSAGIVNPQNQIAGLFFTKSTTSLLMSFFIFGILISFTPCVLPMVPILSSIIIGQGKLSYARSFLLSLLYVLGMAITYALAGIIFGFVGSSIQASLQQPWLISIFVALFIAMALSLFGLYDLQLPSAWHNKLANLGKNQHHGTLLGVLVMGVCSTLVLSPCVTPPLVGVLAYISQSGHATFGGVALFIMGLGMGLPLLLIGTFGPRLLPHTGEWMIAIKQFMGVLMLAVAIWMLARIIPDAVTMWFWGLLFLGYGVALGALSTVRGHLKYLQKTIGLALFMYGLIVIVGATLGNTNPLKPLASSSCSTQHTTLKFIPVRSIDDLYRLMNSPQNQNKPILLDFYADWCMACKEMEATVFNRADVTAALDHFLVLRADVTQNNMTDKILLRHFGVIAPPTILFFDTTHHEVKSLRVVGMIKANALLKRIQAM